jgi:hypothetical protein
LLARQLHETEGQRRKASEFVVTTDQELKGLGQLWEVGEVVALTGQGLKVERKTLSEVR